MSKLSPEARSLLEAARRNYRPSASDRQRLREGVLKRVAGVPASAHAAPRRGPASPPDTEIRSTPAGPSRFTRMHALTLVGASALVVMGFTAVTYTSSDPLGDVNPPAPTGVAAGEALLDAPRATEPVGDAPPPPSPAPDTASTLSPDPPPDPPPGPRRGAIVARPTGASTSGAAVASRPATRPVAPSAAVVPSAAEPRPPVAAHDSLAIEMRILRDAHAAFKRGDRAAAHGYLDEHARSYPRGLLREERLVLSTLVLCSEGHRAEARASADELVREHPRSTHLERLRGSCVADATFPPPRAHD